MQPGAGTYLGGTRLNLSLSQPAPDGAGAMAAHRMACRFGSGDEARNVQATMLDATHLRCVTPAAADAGVVPLRSEEFGALPSGATLHGTATIEGGTLRLTPVEGVGSLSLELPNTGGASLSLSFDLLLGLGSAADGVSLVYGPLPPDKAFDELGSGLGAVSDGRGNWMGGSGLEVSMRTHAVDMLQLAYGGRVFKQRKMHGVLRTSAFVNLSLTVDARGHMVLSLGAGGAPAVLREEHHLAGWAPASDWRLGFGGRCNNDYEMSLDRRLEYHAHAGTMAPSPGPAGACGALPNAQWVDNLVIRSDQLLQSEAAPLRVTFNGQQYTSVADSFSFGYNGALNVSRVAPALGPAAGGTQLRVHGYSFEGGVASEYACRFGSAELGWQQVPQP